MSAERPTPEPMLALVTRTEHRAGAPVCYLLCTDHGAADWTVDPQQATAFASMREAARMALRLPAAMRAYGLPRDAEIKRLH